MGAGDAVIVDEFQFIASMGADGFICNQQTSVHCQPARGARVPQLPAHNLQRQNSRLNQISDAKRRGVSQQALLLLLALRDAGFPTNRRT